MDIPQKIEISNEVNGNEMNGKNVYYKLIMCDILVVL